MAHIWHTLNQTLRQEHHTIILPTLRSSLDNVCQLQKPSVKQCQEGVQGAVWKIGTKFQRRKTLALLNA